MTCVQSPVTGEWHDYAFFNVTGAINKPEDCQWATKWGFEADVWQPTQATISVIKNRNPQGKITSWRLTSTGYSTTRLNHVWCEMGEGNMGGYDRTTTEYFTGGSLASLQATSGSTTVTVPVSPYVAPTV